MTSYCNDVYLLSAIYPSIETKPSSVKCPSKIPIYGFPIHLTLCHPALFLYPSHPISNSSCVPICVHVPPSIQKMRSALCTVHNLCATTNIVVFPLRPSIVSCNFASASASKALVGSSSNSSLGFRTKARAIHSRCFCPPEKCDALAPHWVS